MSVDVTKSHLKVFREDLLEWFTAHARALPWRIEDAHGKRDPYHVWLSEVMLQQTRVDQALPYFERFTEAFPTLPDLANADLDEVLLEWEGLGYYSRARNLHRAVREVMADYGGTIPADEKAFRALPGVGPYTTAAVLSLAYEQPLAVLDGNVIRVLTRVFGIAEDAGKARTRARLTNLGNALIPEKSPGMFNEAVMELGATVCKPRNPDCPSCPLSPECVAYRTNRVHDFPVTRKKVPVPHLDIAVGVLINPRLEILIQQRPEDGMLGGLWEFPGGKVESGESPADACIRELQEELGLDVEVDFPLKPVKHAYSHFKITLHAFLIFTDDAVQPHHYADLPVRWISLDDLDSVAFPRANRKVIEQLHSAVPLFRPSR